jgi:hypothetical protein
VRFRQEGAGRTGAEGGSQRGAIQAERQRLPNLRRLEQLAAGWPLVPLCGNQAKHQLLEHAALHLEQPDGARALQRA